MSEAQKLIIDWTQMPTYNTIMSVAAGAGIMSLVSFAQINFESCLSPLVYLDFSLVFSFHIGHC